MLGRAGGGEPRRLGAECPSGRALHVVLNLLSLASARRWVVTATFPKYYTVPTLLSLSGGIGLLLAVGVVLAGRKRHASAQSSTSRGLE